MSRDLMIAKTGEPWTGQRLDANGLPCNCVRHPPNIADLWTDEELAAVGLQKVPDPEPAAQSAEARVDGSSDAQPATVRKE